VSMSSSPSLKTVSTASHDTKHSALNDLVILNPVSFLFCFV
jgi:hypothetical protein